MTFEQRISVTLAPDAFESLAELAETAGEWLEDMKVTHRRRA